MEGSARCIVFRLKQQLNRIDFIETQIVELEAEIERQKRLGVTVELLDPAALLAMSGLIISWRRSESAS